MDSPSRQSSIIESPSLRKHRDMFPPRHSRSSLPSFAPSTTPLKSPSTHYSKHQEQSIFYSAEHEDSDGDPGHHSPSPAGPPVFKVPTFLSRRAAATSTSQTAGASSSVSALHRHQAAEMEDSLTKLLDDNHHGETNASQQARASTLKARKSLDSLRQSQRRSLDPADRSPSIKSALPPRLRTTETEYDVSPSRTARLMSTPAASSFVGTPSRRNRDFDEQAHVTPENLATLEWLQQTANASENEQNNYATENTERLDQRYTRQTSIAEDEQEQQQYEDPITTSRRTSSHRSYHNSPSSHRRTSERAHDTYSEKENIPAYSDRTAPQGRPSPKSPRYVERVLEPRTPEPNNSVIEAESSLLEVAETTTTLTNELRGVYTKMQDFFSPETEAKLNGAISVIGSQKVARVANGLTSSTTKPRPLEFRSASVRKDYRTPSLAKHSSRPLTEPVPFNFSERLDRLQKRHTPHLLQKSGAGKSWNSARATTVMQHKQQHRDETAYRPSTPPVQSRTVNEYQEMSKSPFIPLDQRKRLLAKSTIVHSEAKRPLTQPKSPVLLTRTRHKSNMEHHQEHLDHEATHHHGYKAHAIDRRTFEQGGISGVPKVTKQPLTVPKSPVFTKRKPAPLRSAVMPSKPNVHHSQQLDKGRMQTGITQRSLVSSAESARRLSEESQNRSLRHDLGPGHHSVRGRVHTAKPALTVPEPFSFVTDARGERYQEQFRNKLGKWKQIEKEQQFKAIPLPEYPDMFVPKKSTRPLTHSEPVVLQTDRRAEEREIYEQERRRKEKLLQDMLAEKAREDELRELQELRELRKRLVPHPTPIRDYPRIEIHKSTRPLTIPHSPNIGEKRKRQMTLEREISSSHEDPYHHHAVSASLHGQYTREDLEQLERELQREQERARDQDFEHRRVSGTGFKDSGEQHQRQDLVRQEIERQRETDAYHRHEVELLRQQQQQQHQQYARGGHTLPAAFEDQEEVVYGYDEEHGHSKRQRFPEEEDPARTQPNFYRRMGRRSWLEANDL
ncbi:Protein tpx2 [Mortierella alpina]|nr:Protein tpx2 [Mortierella alpina]